MIFNKDKLLHYGSNVLVHDFGISPKYPTFVNFSISNRCNARCKMCDIWRYNSDDKKGKDLMQIFSNPILRNVESLGITGGEPFIRSDLVDIVRAATVGMKKIKFIGITTNGFNSDRIRRFLNKICEILEPLDIILNVTVSVDGLENIHDLVRGIPNVWLKVERTIDILKEEFSDKLELRVAATVIKQNSSYESLCALDDYMRHRRIPIIYRMAVFVERIFNNKLIEKNALVSLSDEARQLSMFIDDRLLNGVNSRTQYYEMINEFLNKRINERKIKCMEMRDGGMLDSSGDLFVCSVSGEKIGNLLTDSSDKLAYELGKKRKKVRIEVCSSCFHDHMSHNSPIKLIRRVIRQCFPNK